MDRAIEKKSAGTPQSVDTILRPFTQELCELGAAYVGHSVFSFSGNHTGYMSNETWKREYIEGRLFDKDLIIKTLVRDPFSSVHWSLLGTSDVATTRTHIVKVASGFTICNLMSSFLSCFNLAFSEPIQTEKFLKENRLMLESYHKIYDNAHLDWRLRGLDERNLPEREQMEDFSEHLPC